MRSLKGIRKNDKEKTLTNLTISLSWFASLMNQLGVDLEQQTWARFPYLCSYCGKCPCVCKAKKIQKRVKVKANTKRRPRSLAGLQKMFADIYPPESRTLEHAAIHLAEELGELSEAVLQFRGNHTDKEFAKVELEASDVFSCYMGMFNSLGINYEKRLVQSFKNGCASCHHSPCSCSYSFIVNFKS